MDYGQVVTGLWAGYVMDRLQVVHETFRPVMGGLQAGYRQDMGRLQVGHGPYRQVMGRLQVGYGQVVDLMGRLWAGCGWVTGRLWVGYEQVMGRS